MTENLNNFQYNIIIANMHEMYSFLIKNLDKTYKKETLLENYIKILTAIIPVIPHFANECLSSISNVKVHEWPIYNDNLIEEKDMQIVIQINGKKRGLIKVDKNIAQEELYKLIIDDEKILKYLNDKKYKKIYVKNKLVNLII